MIVRGLNSNHDLFALNGRIAVLRDIDEVAQHIKTRLLLVLGEYFLDVNEGVPWFTVIFTKPADLQEVETVIKNTILTTENVNELTSFSMDYDRITRTLLITFSCNTEFGLIENGEIPVNV